ncbi:TolC family protein [Dyadobacter crusticola]|uniref:TolC family protein n=1 Tax=Dyadobacter crusticola TaxID=292407 RepID=UPI0004E20F72|nr:TolC family protein [Dyadobacter crusticola]
MKYLSKPQKLLRLAVGSAVLFLNSFHILLGQAITRPADQAPELEQATLQDVVAYAIKNQPVIQQSLIDERITENQIRSRLADWYPQINFNYNLQHNFIVQTSIIAGNPVKLGVSNISSAQFTLSQQIFNRDVLLANQTKRDVQLAASQNTANNKTDLAVSVSKAFYDVIATSQQVDVAEEDIVRLERSLRDAENQYKSGIADKIDYKRATISLNNTRANKKGNEEILKAKIEYLKSLMGYPLNKALNITYDTLQMEREIMLDTLQNVDFTTRIEYQILSTQRKLQEANIQYNKWSYLPNIALNGAYNLNFQNNQFTDLYAKNYPNSFGLLTLSLPIFQGGRRKANLRQSEWQLRRLDWEVKGLQNNVNAEYAAALANYKGNLTDLLAQKENVDLAREVYDVIQLQYKSGIKTYLEVVTSETDLRLARINYYNALYQVLASKIDVQRALGQINYL